MQFPLLSKCAHFQKLIPTTGDENIEIHIHDIPGGAKAFEICAKFCYGMIVTLNAYNVIAARCAAEYLEMNETVDKGNLIYKIDVFFTVQFKRATEVWRSRCAGRSLWSTHTAIERSISVSTGGRSTISEQKQESATTVILALVKCMTMYQLCSQIKKKGHVSATSAWPCISFCFELAL